MLNDQQKRDLFNKIRTDAIISIYDKHNSKAWNTWGWVKNQARRRYSQSRTTKAATAASFGFGQIFSKIPLIGPVVVAAAQGKVASEQSKDLYTRACASPDPDDKAKYGGEYMVVSGAQTVADAVRKVNDAAKEMKSKPVTNCRQFTEYMFAVYYYSYRLHRLRMYNKRLTDYAAAVQSILDESLKEFQDVEQKLEREGMKFWDDWQFHTDHCSDDFCTFPWNSLEISGPTPVGYNKPLPPPPPSKAPPPVPPRTYKK